MGTEGHDQGSSLLEGRGTGKTTLGIRKDDRWRTRHDSYRLQYPRTTREDILIMIKREDLMQLNMTYQEVLRWITNTVVGSTRWRISIPTGNSRDSRRG